MFYVADYQAQAYNESWDVVPGAIRPRGFAYVVRNVFGFLFTASLTVLDEVCFIRKCAQVRVDKLTGTGEAILAGDNVYATLASNFQSVTANPTGTIGTDYYFCGTAKKNADADETTVLIDFWGDEYNHADRAA